MRVDLTPMIVPALSATGSANHAASAWERLTQPLEPVCHGKFTDVGMASLSRLSKSVLALSALL